MLPTTKKLWDLQNRHDGDRLRLFRTVHGFTGGDRALYPGSFVDIAASAVFSEVVYADIDKRAPAFFADDAGVRRLVAEMGGAESHVYRFLPNDYREPLDLPDAAFDVLVSLYAGFVSEHCTRYLRVGGFLLANPSHGDVAMATLDDRYELAAVVLSCGGVYRIRTDGLDDYLTPKSPVEISRKQLHERQRGIAYTKSSFAYLFRRAS